MVSIKLRLSRVTACTFGGSDLGEVYIITSQMAIDPAT